MKLAAKAVATGICGLLLLAFAVGPGGAAVAATSLCAHPNALLQAGDYTTAYAAYAAVKPADANCARQGMAAAGALQAASQLISVGLVTEADAEIVRAVEADPTVTLPASLLTKTIAGRAIALAETLNADGFHQQAVQILLFVTEVHARGPLDPAAQAILTPPGEPLWASVGHGIVSYALSWEGLVILAVLLVVGLTYYPLTRRRLHLQPFTLEGADTGADAEHLRDRVRDELQRLAVEHARTDKGHRLRIDIAGPYDEPLDIGSVVDNAPEHLKFIGSLIGLLLKRYPKLSRPRLVTGALYPGIAVSMGIQTVDKTEQCRVTIEHKHLGFPPVSPSATSPVAARYAQLALPAAAWVILNRYDKYTLGGTRSLDSFTKFAVGYAWQQQDDPDEAERYYLQARDADPRNTAAAVNLARLWQQRDILVGTAFPDDPRWRDLLRWVTKATRLRTGDLQWYRSRYLLSLGLADRDKPDQSPVEAEERKQALGLAVGLAIEIMEQLKNPDADVPKEFLENSQGPALALAVSQMIPSTETVDEVVTMGFVPDDVTGDDVLRELKKTRDSGSGTPEVLVPFIEACPPDDEIDYNLYRYQLNRQQACQEAIASLEGELREAGEQALAETGTTDTIFDGQQGDFYPGEEGDTRALQRPGSRNERQRALRTRLEEATGAARDANTALNRYAERLSRSADPVLRARIAALTRAERPHDDPDGPDGQGPPQDRPAASTRYVRGAGH